MSEDRAFRVVPARSRSSTTNPSGSEDLRHLGVRDAHAEDALDAGRAERERPRRLGRGIPIDRRPERLRRADLLEERRRARDRGGGGVDVRAALEARRGFGLQAEPLARAPHRGRLEVRALEHHQLRAAADLRWRAAHHAADRLRAIGVGDHEHVGSSARSTPSSVRSFSPAFRAPDAQRAPGELRVVEGVRRLPHLEHHVVRDVDDRTDAPHAAGLEPIAHPVRRVAGRPHLEHLRAVARAQLGILDRHLDRLRLPRRRHRPIRQLQRQAVGGRRLAREADDAQAVGPVRRDLEIDDGLPPVLDRGDLESAQAEGRGDLVGIAGHRHELAQPVIDELHSGNCSRNRRSFS